MLIRFFRLETENGLGIYHSVCDNKISPWQNITKSGREMFQHDCIHIEPHEDKALGLSFDKIYDESYFFRFLNLDQYKAWFYNPIWRQNLSKYGVMLSVYEIEKRKLRKSPHQVAFRREDGILIERFDPFHFY